MSTEAIRWAQARRIATEKAGGQGDMRDPRHELKPAGPRPVASVNGLRRWLVPWAVTSVVLVATVACWATPAQAVNDSTTTLVQDLNVTGSSQPDSLATKGDTLFLNADDGVHGTEL